MNPIFCLVVGAKAICTAIPTVRDHGKGKQRKEVVISTKDATFGCKQAQTRRFGFRRTSCRYSVQ